MSYIQPTKANQFRRLAARGGRNFRSGMGDTSSDAVASVQDAVNNMFGLPPADPNAAWQVAQNAFASVQAQMSSDPTGSVACVNTANASPTVQALDTRWYNLAQNWKPTGYYKPADVQTILQTGMQAMGGATAVLLTQAPLSTGDAADLVSQALVDIQKSQNDSVRFDTASKAALTTNQPVNAPDLKDWLIQAMLTTSNAYMTVAALQCDTTYLDTLAGYITAAEAVAAQIGGIILAAGQTALNVASGVFDAAAWFSKYSGYIFIAGGVGLLYFLLKDPKKTAKRATTAAKMALTE